MLELLALQHTVATEVNQSPLIREEVAAVAFNFAGRDLDNIALGGGRVLSFTAERALLTCSELANDVIKDKCPIGPQIFNTVDASESGKIVITTKNYGHGADGKYGDPNVPASSWINGVFQGHGIKAADALKTAIATGALPANATEADLAKAGNDVYFSVKGPKGNWIVLGEILGVENYSGDISSSGEIDINAILAKQGTNLTPAQMAKLEVLVQAKGAGGTSLSTVVVSPVKPPVPTTTTTSAPVTTTVAPTTVPPITVKPVVTTTVPATTTTITETGLIPPVSIVRVPGKTYTTPPEIANTGNRPLKGQAAGGIGLVVLGAGVVAFAGKRQRKNGRRHS